MVSRGKTCTKILCCLGKSPVWLAHLASSCNSFDFIPQKQFWSSISLLRIASLVHWYSVITVGLVLIIDPLTTDRQRTMPLACCHSADVFINAALFSDQDSPHESKTSLHNNSNYNPSPQWGIKPLPLLFSQSPSPVN